MGTRGSGSGHLGWATRAGGRCPDVRGQQEVEALTVLQSRRANSHLCTQPRRPLERADTSWAPPRCRPPQSFLCKTGVTPSPPSQDAGEICQAWAGVLGTDPHGSASRDQQAGLPGEGTPSSRVLCGAALGSRSHARTSSPARKKPSNFTSGQVTSSPRQQVRRAEQSSPRCLPGSAPSGGRGARPFLPAQGPTPRRQAAAAPAAPAPPASGPASPAALLLHRPEHGLPAGSPHTLLHLVAGIQLRLQGRAGAAVVADAAAPPRAVLSRGSGGVGVLLQGLQLGQGDDVAVLRPVPHRALGGGVVVVEARRVGVEELPPLVLAGALDAHAGRRVPHALARDQVGVHALARPRLDDLHPLQPGERGGSVRVRISCPSGHPPCVPCLQNGSSSTRPVLVSACLKSKKSCHL